MKFLLLLALFGVLWWVWPRRTAVPPPARLDPPAERMVACAHCGLLLPENDSIGDGERHYCSEAHRRAGEA